MTTEDKLRYFLARSDVEAAAKLLERLTIEDSAKNLDCGVVRPHCDNVKKFSAYIREFWPSWFDGYARVYRTAGQIEAKVPGKAVFQAVAHQWRLNALANFMQAVLPGYAKILDYGCSRGAHAITLHNIFQDKSFTLLDIDEVSISEAKRLVYRLAKHPVMFDFVVGDEKNALHPRGFDGAMLLEVLEHVRDAKALVDKIEASVKLGGWVFCTVPAGPVEYEMWVSQPDRLREHVREFTLDDIHEMFGEKDNLHVDYASQRRCPHTGMHTGCFFFAYQVTGRPTGIIDWDRKLSTARKFGGELPGWATASDA